MPRAHPCAPAAARPLLAVALQAAAWRREASFAHLIGPQPGPPSRGTGSGGDSPPPVAPPPEPAAPPTTPAGGGLPAGVGAEMAVTPRKRSRKSLAPARATAGDDALDAAAPPHKQGSSRGSTCTGGGRSGEVTDSDDGAHSGPRKARRCAGFGRRAWHGVVVEAAAFVGVQRVGRAQGCWGMLSAAPPQRTCLRMQPRTTPAGMQAMQVMRPALSSQPAGKPLAASACMPMPDCSPQVRVSACSQATCARGAWHRLCNAYDWVVWTKDCLQIQLRLV